MQLIKIAMSMGDQGKHKNTDNHPPPSPSLSPSSSPDCPQHSTSSHTSGAGAACTHYDDTDNKIPLKNDNTDSSNHQNRNVRPQDSNSDGSPGFSNNEIVRPATTNFDCVTNSSAEIDHPTYDNPSLIYSISHPRDLTMLLQTSHPQFFQRIEQSPSFEEFISASSATSSGQLEERSSQSYAKSEEEIPSNPGYQEFTSQENTPKYVSGNGDSKSNSGLNQNLKEATHEFDENMNISGIQNNNLSSEDVCYSQPFNQSTSFVTTGGDAEVGSEQEKVGINNIDRQPDLEETELENIADMSSGLKANLERISRSNYDTPSEPTEVDFNIECNARDVINKETASQMASVNITPIIETSVFGASQIDGDISSWTPHFIDLPSDIMPRPPMWTSLALRDHAISRREIVHPLPQLHRAALDTPRLDTQTPPYAFVPISDGVEENNCSSSDMMQQQHISPDSDTMSVCDDDLSENNVFQSCSRSSCSSLASSVCINGQAHLYMCNNMANGFSNHSSAGGEYVTNGNGETDFSLALEDLDCYLRMLPTMPCCRDFFLNQMDDEEIVMLNQRKEEEEDDEDEDDDDELAVLVDLAASEPRASPIRPTNPLAFVLEYGGNEQFLPISSDVFHNSAVHDYD